MDTNKIQHFLLIAFVLITCSANAQNGWVKKKNELYAQASVTTFSSQSYYSTEGRLFDGGSTFNNRGLLLYGEYGLTDRFTATLDAPLVMLNSFSTTEVVAGVGSINLGLKYGLFKSLPIAFSVEFDIPTDDGINLSNAKETNELGFLEQINLPTSDGEFNVWTTLAGSHGFANEKTFMSIYGRVNFRTQNFSNQWQSGVELGHLFFDKLYLIGKLKVQGSLSDEAAVGASFLYGEGTSFTSFNTTVMYKLNKKWSLIASYTDYAEFLVKRKNIYDGGIYSLGVSYSFRQD